MARSVRNARAFPPLTGIRRRRVPLMRPDSQISDPSGLNPVFRINTVFCDPCVKLLNWPLPTRLTHVSTGPSRSERNATYFPSREIAASVSDPSKSVKRVN